MFPPLQHLFGVFACGPGPCAIGSLQSAKLFALEGLARDLFFVKDIFLSGVSMFLFVQKTVPCLKYVL